MRLGLLAALLAAVAGFHSAMPRGRVATRVRSQPREAARETVVASAGDRAGGFAAQCFAAVLALQIGAVEPALAALDAQPTLALPSAASTVVMSARPSVVSTLEIADAKSQKKRAADAAARAKKVESQKKAQAAKKRAADAKRASAEKKAQAATAAKAKKIAAAQAAKAKKAASAKGKIERERAAATKKAKAKVAKAKAKFTSKAQKKATSAAAKKVSPAPTPAAAKKTPAKSVTPTPASARASTPTRPTAQPSPAPGAPLYSEQAAAKLAANKAQIEADIKYKVCTPPPHVRVRMRSTLTAHVRLLRRPRRRSLKQRRKLTPRPEWPRRKHWSQTLRSLRPKRRPRSGLARTLAAFERAQSSV